MIKLSLLTPLIAFVIASTSFGQKAPKEIVYEDFIKEVTVTKTNNEHLKLCMWLPSIFWDIAAAQKKQLTPEMVISIQDALGEYAIFCVADADLSNPLAVKTSSDDQIRKTLSIEYNGKTYKPLAETDLSEVAVIMKTNLEPMFAGMFGNFGSGIKMYFFRINDRNGDPLLDPYKETPFTVSLAGAKIPFKVPLPALLNDKICPSDGEALPGDYKFCPYHGIALK